MKSVEQQDMQAVHRVRELLVAQRTALFNQARSVLGERGVIDRHHDLCITPQAGLLGIGCGSVYYLPRPMSDADLALMQGMGIAALAPQTGTCKRAPGHNIFTEWPAHHGTSTMSLSGSLCGRAGCGERSGSA